MARRKIAPRVGDVFEIPLGDGNFAFGQVLRGNLVGFYAVRSAHRLSIEDIIKSDVAFRAVCIIDTVKDGRWPILGNTPPPAAMNEPIRFWRSTAPGFVFMYEWRPDVGSEEVRVTEADVIGLAESAIWDWPAMVERLQYFFRGEPYPYLKIG